MKIMYTEGASKTRNPSEGAVRIMPKATVHPPARPPQFSQKTKFISENQKNAQSEKIIDGLEARIKKLEKQLRLALDANNKLEKSQNYLKDRVRTLTSKVDGIIIKLKK